MYYFVYKTTNPLNGKFYYGAHSTPVLEDGYKGSGVLIKKAFRKYGKSNFEREIVSFFDNADDMYEFEELLLSEVLGNPDCYNIGVGGRGNMKGLRHTEAAKRKIGEAAKGNTNMLGKKHTNEARVKIGEASKGNTYATGQVKSEAWVESMARLRGKSKSVEHIEKIRAAQKGRPLTEEHRRKLSEAAKRRCAAKKMQKRK